MCYVCTDTNDAAAMVPAHVFPAEWGWGSSPEVALADVGLWWTQRKLNVLLPPTGRGDPLLAQWLAQANLLTPLPPDTDAMRSGGHGRGRSRSTPPPTAGVIAAHISLGSDRSEYSFPVPSAGDASIIADRICAYTGYSFCYNVGPGVPDWIYQPRYNPAAKDQITRIIAGIQQRSAKAVKIDTGPHNSWNGGNARLGAPSVRLRSAGIDMPLLGFGTAYLNGCEEQAVEWALDAG